MASPRKIDQDELKFRVDLGQRLTNIEAKQDGMKQSMEDKHLLLLAKLDPVLALGEKVDQHDRQIQFWKGANAVLGALWMGAIALLAHIRKYF